MKIIKILRFIISLTMLTVGLPLYLLVVVAVGIFSTMDPDPEEEWEEGKEMLLTPFRYLLFRD